MPPVYRVLSARYLSHRWDRAALIVASIAVGVSTLVSSRILNHCLEVATAATTTPLTGAADLHISNGELGVARGVGDDLRAANLAGVTAVRPLIFERVTLPDLGSRPAVLIGAETDLGSEQANSLGVRFTATARLDWSFARLAIGRRLIVLSKPLYDDWGTRRSDPFAPFVVKSGTRSANCLPVGYFEYGPDSPMAQLGLNVIGMELSQAASFVQSNSASGRVTRIDLLLEPGADPEAVRSHAQAVVGDRARVSTPETHGHATREIVGGVQLAFALCSAGAMIVGLFLVYNAMAVTVAERRADIGILRSVGATRSQVVILFGTMAAALGIVGAAAGVPMGTTLARAVLWHFREELGGLFLTAEVDPGWPSAATVAVALLAGTATAVIAALIPALQSAGEDPADAVRRGSQRLGGGWRLAHYLTCAGLIVVGLGLILFRHDLPRRVGAFGGMMTVLVGLLLASPLIVGVLVRLAYPALRRTLPIEARLAADNLLRSPGRTGVVIGALGAGVAVMVQTAGVGKSNKVPVVRWLDEVIRADRFVFAGNLTEMTSSRVPMGPELGRELGRLPGVEGVAGIRYARPEYNGTVVLLVALDANAYAEHTARRTPDGLQVLPSLRELPGGDRALISENFARRHHIRPGEVLALPGPSGPVRLEILGTVKDYSWPRGTVFLDRASYARLFADDLVDVSHVFLEANPDTGDAALSRFAADRGLAVLDRDTMRRMLAGVLDRVNALVFLQQLVVGVVAALGVVTALLISVLQRKRELGLLLAVGATPAQIARSVWAEALLMGAFGATLGILIGLPLEWYILRVIMAEESGFDFDLLIPWKQAGLIAAGALAAATLAGWLPARHAIRTRIPDAIAYE